VRRKKSNLSRFLLYKAATSMDFALKISWWFTALSDTTNEEVQSIAHQLYQEVEMAIVNSTASMANASSKQSTCDFHVSDVFQRLRIVTYLESYQLYQNGVSRCPENVKFSIMILVSSVIYFVSHNIWFFPVSLNRRYRITRIANVCLTLLW
jgi:hypothetical protein